LNPDAAEVAAGAHDQRGFAGLERSDIDEQGPGGRYMADHYGRGMKIELQWNLGGGAGGDNHHLSKAAGPLDAHHARWAGVAVAALRARIKRHDACRRHALIPAL
jgi:hypothetical protein